jgi:hypothetical protein
MAFRIKKLCFTKIMPPEGSSGVANEALVDGDTATY